jgi:hypothetical protein
MTDLASENRRLRSQLSRAQENPDHERARPAYAMQQVIELRKTVTCVKVCIQCFRFPNSYRSL